MLEEISGDKQIDKVLNKCAIWGGGIFIFIPCLFVIFSALSILLTCM